MTDRELLELAAMAAGVKSDPKLYEDGIGVCWSGEDEHGVYIDCWNPLDDDGDALRLAVKLGMDILFTPEGVEVIASQHAKEIDGECISPWACESWALKEQDPYAATRFAIVRAAAEIGRKIA